VDEDEWRMEEREGGGGLGGEIILIYSDSVYQHTLSSGFW
jgi:hypothetical protein